MPCVLVLARSDETAEAVRQLGRTCGWDVRRPDLQAPGPLPLQDVDAALFDLKDPVDRLDQWLQHVADASPFLPLIFLSAQGMVQQELGAGLRYHVDPNRLLDLEHILISLSLSFTGSIFEPPGDGVQGTVPRVLIVDDNIQLASLMGRTLRALERYDVQVTSSGFEAISLLPAFRPNVAIIDLVLSDMDGRDLCVFIRNHERLKDTKIIGMSGYLSESRAEEGKTRFDAFLEKPFRMKDLLEKVTAFLQ